jgi:mannitol-specific phosphotransferase system IIBC component
MAFLAAAAVPLAIAGTVLQGLSQFQQQNYQANVAKNNAKIAGKNADRAGYASQINQMRSDREYAQEGATVLASQAASGLDVLGASQVSSRINITRVSKEQAGDIRQQGLFDVQKFQQEQANFLGEKRAARTAAWMGVASSAFDIAGTLAKPEGQSFVHSLIGGTK